MANSYKDDKSLINNKNIKNTELEIVFFGLAHDKIVGGVKVTYKHAEMIASLGVQSSVYSPDNLGFNCSWFDHNATIRTEHELNKKVILLFCQKSGRDDTASNSYGRASDMRFMYKMDTISTRH